MIFASTVFACGPVLEMKTMAALARGLKEGPRHLSIRKKRLPSKSTFFIEP
jgi:hypothetical protein